MENIRLEVIKTLLGQGYSFEDPNFFALAEKTCYFVTAGFLRKEENKVACDEIPDMVDSVSVYAPKTDPMATYIPSNACTPLGQLGDYCSIEIEPCDETIKKLQILKKHNTLSFYPDAYVRFRKLTREQALGMAL